jgi:hypothetical protein
MFMPAGTSLADQFGNSLSVKIVNGQINIIPEPNQIAPVIGGLALIALALRRTAKTQHRHR